MENIRAKLISTALGASGGMAGLLSISGCSGSNCAACFGCVGTSVGVLLIVMFGRINGNKKEEKNGMA
jgi:hypothetical protein